MESPPFRALQVPKATITVFTSNTTFTSKITDASVTLNDNSNEALLVMDEAGSAAPAGITSPILNCGNALAPFGIIPFMCDITGTSTGAGVYNGTSGRPNVFQGQQVPASGGTAIQFVGVPFDPQQAGVISGPNVRVFRITNLRYNAASLGVYGGGGLAPAFLHTIVAFNGPNFGGNQIIQVVNGTVLGGLVVTSSANASPANFLQCTASNGNAKNDIILTEGFPNAFKVRNWRQIQDNGIPPSGGDWSYKGAPTWTQADVNQNVPNALYNTESGLMFPPGISDPSISNPPPGTGASDVSPGGTPFADVAGVGGIDKAGTVTQGTRVAVMFSTAPNHSNPSVPNLVNLTDGATITGVMALVPGADANGAGGLPTQVPGTTAISDLPGGVAVYEVLFSNPNAIETATITVTVAPGSSPRIAALTATANFAPFYAPGRVANCPTGQVTSDCAVEMTSTSSRHGSGFPVPRFFDVVQGPLAVYDYSKCPKN